MNFKGAFDQNETQIFHYSFSINKVTSLHFQLLEGAFEHFFVLVKDPKGVIRGQFTFKTRIKSYVIAETFAEASNLTAWGTLEDGEWSLDVIRTYPIVGGFDIHLAYNLGVIETRDSIAMAQAVSIEQSGVGWYAGDLHCHSYYSDGRIALEDIIKQADKQALSFMALCDHSIVTTKLPVHNSLLQLGSTEITWDDEGHYNVHGLREFIDYTYFLETTSSKDEALSCMFTDLKSKGCVLTINHPYALGMELNHQFDIRCFETIEVLNGTHLLFKEVDNEKNIRFFDYLWNQGHYITGVGGSDAHKPNYFQTYPIGVPTTYLYCHGLSYANALVALRQGNVFVCSEVHCEITFLHEGQLVLPGDRVSGKVLVYARSKRALTWQLLRNGICIDEVVDCVYSECFDVGSNEYYRLQAKLKEETVLFVNPIHNMEKQASIYDFQTLRKDFEQKDEVTQ